MGSAASDERLADPFFYPQTFMVELDYEEKINKNC
jgi:hypothetical protein